MKEEGKLSKREDRNEDQKEKEKKKVSLIKKKNKTNVWNQLYQNVDIKHVFNINDLIFISQHALKDPSNSQSLLSAIFYYKMISKVAINEDYIAITLKKLDENAFPPQYYLERLRSYGDAKYYNIANYLENLKKQFSHFEDQEKTKEYINYKKQNFVFDEEIKLLDQQVAARRGKLYLIFFSEICPGGVMLKKIIISTKLLRQLGYNVNQVSLDFIKHKHIFFQQIFIELQDIHSQNGALQKYSTMTSALMERQLTSEEIQETNNMQYMDEMIRKKNVNGSYQQQLLSVKVKWTSPHPSIGIFQIEDIKQLNQPYFSSNKRIKKLQLPDIQDELKSLQHLTKIDPSLLEENKGRCCTFKVIETNQLDK